MSSGATEVATLPRDVRVDTLGFLSELDKQHGAKVKTQVKVAMTNDGVTRVTGDFFEALLVNSFVSTVDPARLLKLYEAEKITRAQLLSALSVRKEPLEQFLSGNEINKLSTSAPASPSLRVTRIKGVEVSLVAALKGLGAELLEKAAAAA